MIIDLISEKQSFKRRKRAFKKRDLFFKRADQTTPKNDLWQKV
jgi:hypothetical protein